MSTDPGGAPEPGPGYVYVNWGPEFYARHSASYPDYVGPAVTVNIGWLGLRHILENGGSGFFPIRLVRPYLQDGRLTRLHRAPAFSLPAYAVYPTDPDPGLFGTALDAMHGLVAAELAQVA